MFETSVSSDASAHLIDRRSYLPWPTPSSLWPTYQHVLYLLPGQAYSLLLDDAGRPAGCTHYRNPGALSEDLFLRFLFEQEATLRQPYLRYEVLIGDVPFVLLPDALPSQGQELALARTLLDDAILPGELHRSPCPPEGACALFALLPARQHLLDHYLPSYELDHLSTACIRTAHRLADQTGHALTLTLSGRQVIITALAEGRLQLCNGYPYAEPLEAIYFMQSVRQITGLDQRELTCYVMGETNPADHQPSSLWHHLPGLQTPPLPGLLGIELPEKVPHWRFLFLGGKAG